MSLVCQSDPHDLEHAKIAVDGQDSSHSHFASLLAGSGSLSHFRRQSFLPFEKGWRHINFMQLKSMCGNHFFLNRSRHHRKKTVESAITTSAPLLMAPRSEYYAFTAQSDSRRHGCWRVLLGLCFAHRCIGTTAERHI
ncbi:MAG TPA: hypothetical protein VG538_14855 [Vicinamibacterales bacterium]|jgi:hypothetical protein|nr:hypothetical protein [Vicinamibacterales bacterium]